MDEKNFNRVTMPNNIIIENREKIRVTGVVDIHSFDDEVVLAQTELGILTIKGEDLKMSKLSLETNELVIDGKISSAMYSEILQDKAKGMFGKIFK